MGREDVNRALAGIEDAVAPVDDEWMTPLTDDQRREVDEIVMMVDQIAKKGYRIDYSFRGYDNKHYVILEGDKCYGQAPKVHAYLSGAYAIMDWGRKRVCDTDETISAHSDECYEKELPYPPCEVCGLRDVHAEGCVKEGEQDGD